MAEKKHYAILNMKDNKIVELATCTEDYDAANKKYVDDHETSGWTGSNVCYVGKHGNDTNTGTDPSKPKLTIGAAMTYVGTQTPSAGNRWMVQVLDGGIYTEDFTMQSWTMLDAPSATVVGTITHAANAFIKLMAIQPITTGTALVYTGTGATYIDIGKIETDIAPALSISSVSIGTVYGNIGTILVSGGNGISTSNAGGFNLKVNLIQCSSLATGIYMGSSNPSVINAQQISGSLSFDVGISVANGSALSAIINSLSFSGQTAYNVASGGVLNLFVGTISGTETGDAKKTMAGFLGNQPNDINSLASATPATDDVIIFEDQSDSWNKKKSAISALPASVALRDEQFNGFMYSDPDTGSAYTFGASFTDLTRTFTLTKTSGPSPAYFYSDGTKFEFTTPSTIVIGDVEGLHYIYFDEDGVLQETTTWDDDIILRYCIVAIVYWDATNSKHIYLGHEYLHGIKMGSMTHDYLHNTVGFRLATGGGLTDILVDQDGSLETHGHVGVQATDAFDEDARFEHSAKLANSLWNVYYRDGQYNWRVDGTYYFPVLHAGTRLYYNELAASPTYWKLTEVPSNNQYVLAHIFTQNDSDRPFAAIMGQAVYSTLPNAREGALTEITSIRLEGLPTAEMKFLGTVIYQTSSTYGNSVNARIRSTGDGGDYIDWRNQLVGKIASSPSVPLAHASTHITGGGDVIPNASSSATGLCPILTTDKKYFLDANGEWQEPPNSKGNTWDWEWEVGTTAPPGG